MHRLSYFALLLAPLMALGHHSNAEFDFEVVEELEGRVSMVSWRNPHVRLMLSVVGNDGTEALWDLEAQDVNSLGRRGLDPEMIREGDVVRVAGNPSMRRDNSMYVTNVLLPSGTEINMRGTPEPRWSAERIGFDPPVVEEIRAAAGEAEGIFRVWMEEETRPFPADLPLTPSASAAEEAWDPADHLTLQCVAGGMPGVMTRVPAPHPIDFTEQDGEIVLRVEVFDVVRTIHMESGADASEQPATPLGYSEGHWEGNTLVVRTTRVSWPYFNQSGSIPQSEAVQIDERFTVGEDDRLVYDLVVTDSATLTEPVSARFVLGWRPDLVVEPYECIPGA